MGFFKDACIWIITFKIYDYFNKSCAKRGIVDTYGHIIYFSLRNLGQDLIQDTYCFVC